MVPQPWRRRCRRILELTELTHRKTGEVRAVPGHGDASTQAHHREQIDPAPRSRRWRKENNDEADARFPPPCTPRAACQSSKPPNGASMKSPLAPYAKHRGRACPRCAGSDAHARPPLSRPRPDRAVERTDRRLLGGQGLA